MTTKALDLPVLLPRGAECEGCVVELGRELGRVDGVGAVDTDVARGLVHVEYDNDRLSLNDLSRYARRVGAQAHCPLHCPDQTHVHGPLDLELQLPEETAYERRLAHVTGMDCADCALKLEAALRSSPGVIDAGVNFGAATLAVTYDAGRLAWPEVLERVRRHGYDTLERRAAAAPTAVPAVTSSLRRRFWLTDRRALLTLASGAFVAGGFVAQHTAAAAAPWLFAAAMVLGGSFVARAAFYSVRARQVDMNVLMSIAALGAAAIGQWSEAALVTFLFALGNVLQLATLERTRRAIRGLVELAPREATVLRGAGEEKLAVDQIRPGDVVVARPGERLAVDGVVTSGMAAVDQAPITGESMPVGRQAGDRVFAGSIVQGGSLLVRAVGTAADNTIAKIVHLVEEAQAQRAPAQGVVDRFARRYTPVVVSLAALVAVVPSLLGQPTLTWVYRGLALLIISCPCALVISTPVSILAALGNATRSGVLIKGGVFLEQAAGVAAVALDKTGTLTQGVPAVTDVVALHGGAEHEVLAVAAALERSSEHPLSRAIVARAGLTHQGCACADNGAHGSDFTRDQPVARSGVCDVDADGHEATVVVRRFRAITGIGVRADIDGQTWFVGRPELLGAAGDDEQVTAVLARLEGEGKTAVVVGTRQRAAGVIAVADPLRPGVGDALERLRREGVAHIALLTGDNEATAVAVGRAAGVHDVRAGLLPADKVEAVHELETRHGRVAMIGDGVNDAPALAAATIGVAMGAAGTDAALETADVVLMGDNIAAFADLMVLSRRTNRIVRQNVAFSVAVKAAFLVLAPLGLATLWMAVFADMGTSLAVIGNGLRLQR
jgi:Cd2+/Zn2+-exporting ATPase